MTTELGYAVSIGDDYLAASLVEVQFGFHHVKDTCGTTSVALFPTVSDAVDYVMQFVTRGGFSVHQVTLGANRIMFQVVFERGLQ